MGGVVKGLGGCNRDASREGQQVLEKNRMCVSQ